MKPTDYVRDQLVLAQHHVNDAREAHSEAVKDSSLSDLDEIVGRISRVLPRRARQSVRAERLNKEAKLALDVTPIKFINTEGSLMTTPTASELRKMAEEAELIDRANAFELGFAKAAAAAGLNEAQYQAARAFGLELLKQSAASTDTAELADGRIKSKEKTEKSLKPAKKPVLPA